MKNEILFKWLFLINFAVNLGFGIADAFFSTYLFGLGGRGVLLGLPLLFFSLSKILFGPVMGMCSDRFGARRTVTVSLSLYLVVSLGYLASSSLALIAALRLVQGVACAMFRPVMLSLVSSSAPERRQGRRAGAFDVSFYAALALGPLLGGVIHDLWGFYGIFSALALSCLLALWIALAKIPRDAGAAADLPTAQRGAVLATLAAARHGAIRGLLAFIFARACGISLLAGFLPIFLNARLGLTGTESGLVLASTTLVITFFLHPAGMLADRVPRRSLVLLGGVSVSLLYFLIPQAQGFSQVLLLGGGIGLCSVVSQPASTALLLEQGEHYGKGLALGVFNAALNLGFVVGPLIGACLQNRFGLTSVFHAAGSLGLVAAGLFVVHNRPWHWRGGGSTV